MAMTTKPTPPHSIESCALDASESQKTNDSKSIVVNGFRSLRAAVQSSRTIESIKDDIEKLIVDLLRLSPPERVEEMREVAQSEPELASVMDSFISAEGFQHLGQCLSSPTASTIAKVTEELTQLLCMELQRSLFDEMMDHVEGRGAAVESTQASRDTIHPSVGLPVVDHLANRSCQWTAVQWIKLWSCGVWSRVTSLYQRSPASFCARVVWESCAMAAVIFTLYQAYLATNGLMSLVPVRWHTPKTVLLYSVKNHDNNEGPDFEDSNFRLIGNAEGRRSAQGNGYWCEILDIDGKSHQVHYLGFESDSNGVANWSAVADTLRGMHGLRRIFLDSNSTQAFAFIDYVKSDRDARKHFERNETGLYFVGQTARALHEINWAPFRTFSFLSRQDSEQARLLSFDIALYEYEQEQQEKRTLIFWDYANHKHTKPLADELRLKLQDGCVGDIICVGFGCVRQGDHLVNHGFDVVQALDLSDVVSIAVICRDVESSARLLQIVAEKLPQNAGEARMRVYLSDGIGDQHSDQVALKKMLGSATEKFDFRGVRRVPSSNGQSSVDGVLAETCKAWVLNESARDATNGQQTTHFVISRF